MRRAAVLLDARVDELRLRVAAQSGKQEDDKGQKHPQAGAQRGLS
jgi:hypothetical protein